MAGGSSARPRRRSTWFTAAVRSARESISVPSRSKATCSYTRAARGLMARLLLHRERRAAAAGVRGLRVRELEAAAVEARDEVDLGAGQVRGAGRIDQDPDPIVLEHLVPLSRVLVEVELVAEPRASAPNHRDAERVGLREPLLRPHLLHHLDRPGRQDERRSGRRAYLFDHAGTIEAGSRKDKPGRPPAPAGRRSLPILPIVRQCGTPPGGSQLTISERTYGEDAPDQHLPEA